MLTHSRHRGRRSGPVWAVLGLALLLCPRIVQSEFAGVDAVEVPVDRVAKNIEARLAQTPGDVQLRLNLARTHMMAFVVKSSTISVPRGRETDGPAWGGPMEGNVLWKEQTTTDPARLAAARAHLSQAIVEYERVIAAVPDNAVARLGYAWALQSSGQKAKAIDAYRATIRIAFPVESTKPTLMGYQTVTEEAALYLIKLLDPEKDRDEIATLKGFTAKIQPMKRMITPIAIPLRDGMTAFGVVNPSAHVLFDLDGSGVRKPWTWITEDAGWLVMDWHGRRRIQSGLQLFGNVTFWLFWDNGYEAMRSLDDDGDGQLKGAELAGLAIWRDANSDGVSNAREVRSLGDWGIIELSCDYVQDARHPDEIVMSPGGVRFSNGHTRSTFDVVLHPWPAK